MKKPKKRRFPWWAWTLLVLVGLSGVLYGVDIAMGKGTVPRGVTVGGVDIGGMSPAQAEQRLRLQLGDQVREPVTIAAGNLSTVVQPTQSGLQVDWSGTVEQAGQQPLNPITRIRSFFESREVGIVSSFSDQVLGRTLDRVTRDLTREPSDAALAVAADGRPAVTPDVPGQTVDGESLRRGVEENWLSKDHRVNVDATVTQAHIVKAAADKAARDVIVPATGSNLVFHGRDGVNALITAPDMSRILTFKPEGEGFAAQWNTDVVKEILGAQLASTEVKFRNANFTTQDGGLAVIPHQDGVEIKWDETIGDFAAKALDSRERNHEVLYEDKKATYTTEQAQRATFNDTVGEFTTGGFESASGVNIRRVAEMVDGAIVLPGETFSLNGYTGPRGTAQGFVESGVIQDGHADRAVGGGISQFATTLYNASYFAGMEDVAHTPHSYYISRYPAGREATVFEGAIDLKFKNPFDTPVRIVTSADSNSVTVKLMGVKQVTVESIPGGRSNPTSPKRIELSGDNCVPSSGAPGFTTTDTRVVKNLDGSVRSRETSTTVYDPAPIVSCRR